MPGAKNKEEKNQISLNERKKETTKQRQYYMIEEKEREKWRSV